MIKPTFVNPAWGQLAGGFVCLAMAFPLSVLGGTFGPLLLDGSTTDTTVALSDRLSTNLIMGRPWLALVAGGCLGVVGALWQRAAILGDYQAVCKKTAYVLIGQRRQARAVALRSRWKSNAVIAVLPFTLLLLNVSTIVGLLGFCAGFSFVVFPTTHRLCRDADNFQGKLPLDDTSRRKARRYRHTLSAFIVTAAMCGAGIVASSTFLTITKVVPMTREIVEVHEENEAFERGHY